QYNTSCTYTKTPYSAWQYTSKGHVKGITGNVDCNFWYGDDGYFELSKPPQVYGISQSAKSDTSISLKWTKAADVDEYHIYRASSAGGEYVEIGTSDTNTYKDTGLAFNKSYYYKVSASNSAGTGLMSSCFKAATVSVPSKVTGLVQTGKVKDTVTISWTGNSDADSYNIYRASSAGGKYTLSGTSKKNSFTDSGLKVKTAYYYKVEAVNGAGTGEKSDALKAETISETGKVTGIVRTARTRSTITFKWTADENAEGYYVYRSNAYNGTYTKIAQVSENTYKDTGRTAGRSYYYKIKAYNMLGEGTVSGIQTLTSLPKTDRYGTVTGTSAVIYKRAGSSFSKLMTVTKGEVLTIYASTVDINGKTWYKVINNGVTGYIKGTDVTIKSKVTTAVPLNLRKGPSTSYGTYGVVPAGVLRAVKATKIISGNTWYQVTYKIKGVSRTGWICGYTPTASYVKVKNL
ncbi:MAG: fibronectin type III domain-containing protein, partial [Firmicutes bacterium]|nr:fibronectin type III domain-containing protein [Bacillota bacterium]